MGKESSEASEAQKKAFKKYNAKCKEVKIRYTPNELSEHECLQRYLTENHVVLAKYLKELIRADLESKGYYV